MTEGRPRLNRCISQPGECHEFLFKVLVVGELGTGKTSFIKRYVHHFFSSHYRATIGVDFALKIIHWDAENLIRIQLWDLAGQERFGQMTRVYYKEAAGALIVFDVTRPQTFTAALKWKQDIDNKVRCPDGTPIPCILLANKCDEEKQGSLGEEEFLDSFCEEHGFAGWYYTSPKENINIDVAARALVKRILHKAKKLEDGKLSVIDDADQRYVVWLTNNQQVAPKKKCC